MKNAFNCPFDFYQKPDTTELYPQIPISRDAIQIESDGTPSDSMIREAIESEWERKEQTNLVIDAILTPELLY